MNSCAQRPSLKFVVRVFLSVLQSLGYSKRKAKRPRAIAGVDRGASRDRDIAKPLVTNPKKQLQFHDWHYIFAAS
jgi:hypothetical protein